MKQYQIGPVVVLDVDVMPHNRNLRHWQRIHERHLTATDRPGFWNTEVDKQGLQKRLKIAESGETTRYTLNGTSSVWRRPCCPNVVETSKVSTLASRARIITLSFYDRHSTLTDTDLFPCGGRSNLVSSRVQLLSSIHRPFGSRVQKLPS
jgi:hypothetical protein